MPRAVLKLESIGDNLIALADQMNREIDAAGALLAWGRIPSARMQWAGIGRKRPWVARIKGRDARYGLAREFLRGTKDYSEANSTGSRGVHYYFTMTDGLYEIFEHVSWKNARRYFIGVVHGEILPLTEEEVEACLKEKEESAATS